MPSSLSFCSKTSSVLVAMVTIWLLAFCADIGAGFLVTSTFYSNPLRLHKLKAYRIYNDHTAVMSRVPVKESSEQPLISEDDIEYSHVSAKESSVVVKPLTSEEDVRNLIDNESPSPNMHQVSVKESSEHPSRSEGDDAPIPLLFDAPQVSTKENSVVMMPLSFEEDIRNLIDIESPYYALKDEHIIVDSISQESLGLVCTVQREMPISRESGIFSFGETGRHSAAAATVAAALENPSQKRSHYLASSYTTEVTPREGTVLPQELSRVIDGGNLQLPSSSDNCVIYCRCEEVNKRDAFVEVFFVTKEDIYHIKLKIIIVPARVFKSMYVPTKEDGQITFDRNPYKAQDGGKCDSGHLKNLVYSNEECHDDWVSVEATLDAMKSIDCLGHFYRGCSLATPHSVMLLHNGDLIGQALEKLCGRKMPYKMSNNGSYGDWGIKMKNWQCTPEALNFANTEGLHFQVEASHSGGRLGMSGSTYKVKCLVKGAEEGKTFYEGTGTFVINPLN